MIYDMPITIISVCIRKWLIQSLSEELDVLDTAQNDLTVSCPIGIEEMTNKGIDCNR